MARMETSLEEFIKWDPQYEAGIRVKIIGKPIGMRIPFKRGTIISPDEYAGNYLIKLDRPATYINADGSTEKVTLITEAYDNLKLLPSLKLKS